jgi:hypothetical protein
MKQTYLILIADVDKTLEMLRMLWLDAKPLDKSKYWSRIESILEERFRLMTLRDTVPI